MKLLLDIGNTSAKLMVVDDCASFITGKTEPAHFERVTQPWGEAFARLTRLYPIGEARISTVAAPDENLHAALATQGLPTRWLDWTAPCPVKTVTDVPSGLGADRWAACIGALAQDPTHTALVIDAGTCLTYDLISATGRYVGGVISPGVQLRLRAMHEHTALLPLYEADEEEPPVMGTDTRSNMMSAAICGTRFEIEGYIRHILRRYPDLHVFQTGGNNLRPESGTHCTVTHDPHLVFRGLAAL